MIAKLKCWWLGHLRGKAVGRNQLDKAEGCDRWETRYQCPRCKATWTRKVKSK